MKKILLITLVAVTGCAPSVLMEWDEQSKARATQWCKSIGGDSIAFHDTTERTRGAVLSYAVCLRGYDSLGVKDIVFFHDVIDIGG